MSELRGQWRWGMYYKMITSMGKWSGVRIPMWDFYLDFVQAFQPLGNFFPSHCAFTTQYWVPTEFGQFLFFRTVLRPMRNF